MLNNMPNVYFINTFKSNNVKLVGEFIKSESITLSKQYAYIINIPKNGMHLYRYEVDGKSTHCDNKLSILGSNNIVWNYIVTADDDFDVSFKNQSIAFGDIDIIYTLGKQFMNEKKYLESIALHKIAAKKGHICALNDLGVYYQLIDKNFTIASYYYKQAVALGASKPLINIAYYHEDSGDHALARNYYKEAINMGNDLAMFRLGEHYEKIKNEKKMIKYFDMGLKAGNKQALDAAIKYYSRKIEECKTNFGINKLDSI